MISHPFQEGVGTVMSHPLQRGVGGLDESPKEGSGDRDESSKRGDKGGGGQIMVLWGRSVCLTTEVSNDR